MKYTIEDLKRDLRELDERTEALDGLAGYGDENIVAPVYIAKKIELYSKYLGLERELRANG